ncbi:MAG TPA: IPT/TIG domain-containing protein, partial [Roseiflexaceae bacterium]|nr:IPT/TIG domain-containing protein [Roseiflexaceae bacterium]
GKDALCDQAFWAATAFCSSSCFCCSGPFALTWQKLKLPPLPQPASFPQPWRLAIDPFDESRLTHWSDYGMVISLPTPTISALSRSSAPVGSPAMTLTVTGTNFNNETTIQLNGVYRVTRFVSSTQVETTLYAADLATPGATSVKAGWPGATESLSNALPFAVTGTALQIQRLSPDLATAGDAGLTVTVQGREFASGATLRWNGAARPTTVVSSTQLTAQISSAELAAPGEVAVTVANPAPDGRVSNTATFMIAPQTTPVARRLRPVATAGAVSAMNVTPDGANVVYLANQDNAQIPELYIVALSGGAPRKLHGTLPTGDSVRGFQLSNDGKYAVYTHNILTVKLNHFTEVSLFGKAGANRRVPADRAAINTTAGTKQRAVG